MKKKSFSFVAFVLLVWLILGSCREDSEYLSSYFEQLPNTEISYAGQFKTFWTFLDCNYTIWDYEASYGLNWDSIYAQYLPKFEELDRKNKSVQRDTLMSLYKEIVEKLHDGHMTMTVWDPLIWQRPDVFSIPINLMPQYIRNEEQRSDFDSPQISIKPSDYYDSQLHDIFYSDSSCWGRFIDNIVYFRLEGAANSPLKERNEWQYYYSKIKELSGNNYLKGVIIDLRNFNGGNAINFHYLLGFIHPVNITSGKHRVGWDRSKSGLGRFDYNPQIGLLCPIDNDYQLYITEVPIVVVSNCMTGSLGEIVCYAVKQIKNGCVIGMRTWGGMNPTSKSFPEMQKYCVLGDENGVRSPLYVSIPNSTFITDSGEILEGKGITPDIEVELDVNEYETTGRDTQLERALEFIRTGK